MGVATPTYLPPPSTHFIVAVVASHCRFHSVHFAIVVSATTLLDQAVEANHQHARCTTLIAGWFPLPTPVCRSCWTNYARSLRTSRGARENLSINVCISFFFLLVLHPFLVLSLLPISCCDYSCIDDAVVLRHFRGISPLPCLKALTELPVEFPG